ncbi:MAG: serine hydrolase domain-containing protein, partial [Pseudomonadota bacterium]
PPVTSADSSSLHLPEQYSENFIYGSWSFQDRVPKPEFGNQSTSRVSGKIDMKKLESTRPQDLMDEAVTQGVFPGGVLLVAAGHEVIGEITAGSLDRGEKPRPVSADTIYDLASLTKVLSTTVLTMIFIDQGRFSLESPLAGLWPGPVPQDKKDLTLARLLSHSSGFLWWKPFYELLADTPVEKRRAAVAQAILAEPLDAEPGTRAIYSDLNFILLGFILETFGGRRQDVLFHRLITRPLGLKNTGYSPLDRGGPTRTDDIAATEVVPRRGGLIRGVVHDDNAFFLSGVAGHAGLFGTVREVWTIFNSLRISFRGEAGISLVSQKTVQTFWRRSNLAPGSPWALGFDGRSQEGPSSGRYFSDRTVGHLGYTGTSLWYDPDKDLTVILLTNRVHPTAENEAIKAFRPRLHDAVVEVLNHHGQI